MNIQTKQSIQSEVGQLRKKIRAINRQYLNKYTRLELAVKKEYSEFINNSQIDPANLSSETLDELDDFQRSFGLLCIQMEQWLNTSTKPKIHEIPAYPPTDTSLDNAWEDYLFDLEDMLTEIKRAYELNFRSTLLDFLKIIDSVERLKGYPETIQFTKYEPLKKAGNLLHKHFCLVITRRGIKPFQLKSGEYPPIEKTRIISRSDQSNSESFVIDRVIENGYSYKNQILRKAAVIIMSAAKEN